MMSIDKRGDNQVLKFYMETVNDNFLPDNSENMLEKSINKILEIIFRPLIRENGFYEEYVEQEKENLKQIIQGKIDNKANYAIERCIEEMYHDKVLEYSLNVSLRVVNYSLLKQMGAALGVVEEINKHNRDCCNYGEPYFKMYLVGLSKVTVKVKIKRRFGIFNR